MKRRKPRVKKEDASMIAIRIAVEHGADVGLEAKVGDALENDWWSVFVPDRVPGADPGGWIIHVHKQTGEGKLKWSL